MTRRHEKSGRLMAKYCHHERNTGPLVAFPDGPEPVFSPCEFSLPQILAVTEYAQGVDGYGSYESREM
jgi:hypothetical protein